MIGKNGETIGKSSASSLLLIGSLFVIDYIYQSELAASWYFISFALKATVCYFVVYLESFGPLFDFELRSLQSSVWLIIQIVAKDSSNLPQPPHLSEKYDVRNKSKKIAEPAAAGAEWRGVGLCVEGVEIEFNGWSPYLKHDSRETLKSLISSNSKHTIGWVCHSTNLSLKIEAP